MSSEPLIDPAAEPARPSWRVRLRRLLFTGLVTLIPVALTVFILVKLFQVMDGIFAPVIDRVIGVYLPGVRIPGLGFLLTILVILVLGWLSTNVFGSRLIQAFERLIGRIPVAKSVYSATKGVLESLSLNQSEAFKRVVLIEYPMEDTYALAFVTGNARWPSIHPRTADALLLFLPTTPNPTSGYLLVLPRDRAIDLPITVEEGIRLIISGGILQPRSLLPGAVPGAVPASSAPVPRAPATGP